MNSKVMAFSVIKEEEECDERRYELAIEYNICPIVWRGVSTQQMKGLFSVWHRAVLRFVCFS